MLRGSSYPPTYPIEIQVPAGEADAALQRLDAHEEDPDADSVDGDAPGGDPGKDLHVFGIVQALTVFIVLHLSDLRTLIHAVSEWF